MKRPLLLCLIATILSAEDAFLLPHRWQDARHAIDGVIRTAPSKIVIVTDTLDDPVLRRTVRGAAEHNKTVILITGSAETASRWAIYKSVRACLLPVSEPLRFSLVVTDAQRACFAGSALSMETMRSRYGIVRCEDGKAYAETLRLLEQECTDYFER